MHGLVKSKAHGVVIAVFLFQLAVTVAAMMLLGVVNAVEAFGFVWILVMFLLFLLVLSPFDEASIHNNAYCIPPETSSWTTTTTGGGGGGGGEVCEPLGADVCEARGGVWEEEGGMCCFHAKED